MDYRTPTLKVFGVSKQYGTFTAVDGISFNVCPGRIFGFLGPNGAGKTTILRLIVGIIKPDIGNIELFGEPLSNRHQARVGYLPEERGLYKKMKVFEQLRYFAVLKGVPRKDADEKIDFWLDRLQLFNWKRKRANELSKGMQQKVQFISTLLHDPDLLVLDEPFSGLDPVNLDVMLDVIDDLKRRGKAIVFSTHSMETAEQLCDDIILINKAHKVLEGSVREIKAACTKKIVALRATVSAAAVDELPFAERVLQRAGELEITLRRGVDPQELLRHLIGLEAVITKFELAEPSLSDIFKEKTKEADA
jgi:ABC-2 type transport system ATP-binding protein